MHAFISFCILISCCIHTTLTRPLHLHLLNFRNAGAGGNASESNEGGEKFIGGASVTAFLLEQCSYRKLEVVEIE